MHDLHVRVDIQCLNVLNSITSSVQEFKKPYTLQQQRNLEMKIWI